MKKLIQLVGKEVKLMENSENPNKDKKKNFTVDDRYKILKRIESGESREKLAIEYNVTKQAISMIKKRKTDILEAKTVLEKCDGNFKKKRYTGIEEDLVEKKLFEWFKQCRSMNLPVSGHMLKKKAIHYNQQLGGKENFSASDGWIDKFKKRHGLHQRSVHGEKASADLEGSEAFKSKLDNIRRVTGIELDCIYNCDETALYYKVLPKKSLVLRSEKRAEGRKIPKNRITVMLCTNASGTHKLPLYIIGKSAMPRCFKGIHSLPVIYTHQTNAWMTCTLMKEWYSTSFLPEVRKKHDLANHPNIKIILIMDNAACHPPAQELNEMDSSCSILYLPPNVTSVIQPLDQGIIENFKRFYKKILVDRAFAEDEIQKGAGDQFLRSITILDCCNFSALAWTEVTSKTIRNCWKNLIPIETNDDMNNNIESISMNEFYLLLTKIEAYNSLSLEDVESWCQIDADSNGWEPRTDDDIIFDRYPEGNAPLELQEEISLQDEESAPSDTTCEDNSPTFSEALSSINTLLKWYQKNNDCKNSNFEHLQKMQRDILKQFVHRRLS